MGPLSLNSSGDETLPTVIGRNVLSTVAPTSTRGFSEITCPSGGGKVLARDRDGRGEGGTRLFFGILTTDGYFNSVGLFLAGLAVRVIVATFYVVLVRSVRGKYV